MISAVFFDFGGVVLSSPFEAFNQFETENRIPLDTIRSINATNPDDNAWARLERNEVDAEGFDRLFSQEAAELGYRIGGRDVLRLIHGDIRPEMVTAIERIKSHGLGIACLTNNVSSRPGYTPTKRDHDVAEVMELFDEVVESSVVGVRKPEPEFYRIALERMNVEPQDVVFLDDLGVNLKPARAMGMTTIKVNQADQALAELETVIGIELR